MIKEMFICLALFEMNGVINEKNICENIETLSYISKEYNIDTYTYVSMLWVESNFNKEIVSYTGKACGISQVVPKWTRPKKSCKDLNTDITASVKDNVLEQGEDTLTFLGNYVEQIDSDLDKTKLKEVMKDLYTEASER